MTDITPMRIVRLTAENVKRLKAVEIAPTGDLVTITGRNAQGKSSVLDAIWLALGGGAASKTTARPVRDGETKARVTLDLGELTVTRTWSGTRSTLTVTNADGAAYSSPQGVLDALIGKLAFDPLQFTRLSAREQRDALLDLVQLDVDILALDAQRKTAYDERTEIGRRIKELGAIPALGDNLPEAETSAASLIEHIRAAEQQRRTNAAAVEELVRIIDHGRQVQAEIERLQQDLDGLARRHAEQKQLVDALPAVPDVTQLEADLAGLEVTNQQIRDNNEARRRHLLRDQLTQAQDAATRTIEELDGRKAEALATATFPIDGLGFDEAGVTFGGVPFGQASSAEQIRVSLAMAMALNPKLRVIRILDGSLLDDDNLAMVADAARAGGYQVWIERVADASASAIVIEDGQVAS